MKIKLTKEQCFHIYDLSWCYGPNGSTFAIVYYRITDKYARHKRFTTEVFLRATGLEELKGHMKLTSLKEEIDEEHS